MELNIFSIANVLLWKKYTRKQANESNQQMNNNNNKN